MVDIKQLKDRTALMDGVVRNKFHPESFRIPGTADKAMIMQGDFIKIGIEWEGGDDGPSGERFWVQIVSRDGDKFVGRVDNELVGTKYHTFGLDDHIEFEERHVLSVYDRGTVH